MAVMRVSYLCPKSGIWVESGTLVEVLYEINGYVLVGYQNSQIMVPKGVLDFSVGDEIELCKFELERLEGEK